MYFLWVNRERPSLFSARWLKVWLKRIYNIFGLMTLAYRRSYYRALGIKSGPLTIFCRLDLNGSGKRLRVGDSSFIGDGVHFALHDEIQIGNFVCINSNVHFLSASHSLTDPLWRMKTGKIIVNDYAWIAYNAIILPGVTIGRGAVVGAGAVVSRDVPDFAVVAGNPARVVSSRCTNFEYSPVEFCAPFESWLGKPTKVKK